MENLVFTQLSVPEIRQLFRQELKTYFESNAVITTQPPTDLWLDVNELCNYMPEKPTKATVYGWINKSGIPHHKRAKKLFFLKSEIDKWLRAGRKKNVTEISDETDEFLQHLKKRG